MSGLNEAVEALHGAVERQSATLDRIDRRARAADEEVRLGRALGHRRNGFRRLTSESMLLSLPAILGLFRKEVPPEFWTQPETGVAMVACPCGHEPVIPENGTRDCTCTRTFLFTGTSVRVALRPHGPEPADS